MRRANLSSSVVCLGDGVELFLAGGVPQHQSNIFAACSAQKVHTFVLKSFQQKYFIILSMELDSRRR